LIFAILNLTVAANHGCSLIQSLKFKVLIKLNNKNRKFITAVLICLLIVFTSALFSSKTSGQTQSPIMFEGAFPNLTFNQPDGIFPDPTKENRLFVMEQRGVIKVFDNTRNVNHSTVFLDISDRLLYGGEQGLLGLAFHPNFVSNGYFYVDYVMDNPRRTVIARYSVMESNPNIANKNSEQVVMEINQPFSNHKGGQLAFGSDGYLYIGMGDGGSGGDPFGNGQNRSTLLGKILRIDVDSSSNGQNYAIPNDNPFVANSLGYREEIYAYGFRNPWRFSFDSVSGQLWVGDVGQDLIEEIDLVVKGRNYGWNIMEGSLCYNPATDCDKTGLELPIWNYSHDVGNAIVGGYVYHGSALPDLAGAYVYGDYGSGRIWFLRYDGTTAINTLMADTGLNIASFGLDQQRELFFTAYDGKIYRLTSAVIPEIPWQTGLVFLVAATLLVVVLMKKSKKLSMTAII
jgi:glucose/arabinose dehydrogenase